MGKKRWIHRANKNRTEASDTDRLTKLMSYIPKKFKAAQYQTLKLPNGKYGQRRPDVLIEMYGYEIPIEHDGGVHGFNDDLTETKKTADRNDEYVRDGLIPIIVNEEQLKGEGISEDVFVKSALILLEPIFRAKRRLEP